LYGQFFVIFALLLTGYVFRKINIISEEVNRGLSKFIIYFSFPCLVFYKVASIEVGGAFLKEFFTAAGLSALFFLVFGLYVFLYAKMRRFPKEDASSAELVMLFPNNAFMGFPIAFIFYGDAGLLLMLANNIAMNLTLFSYGILVLRRDDVNKRFSPKNLLKCFLNPNIIALAAGLLFYSFVIPVPGPVGTYLSYIGSLCTPIAMIYVGAMLVGTNIIEVLKNRVVLESAVNKNLVAPVLAYAMVAFLPLPAMTKAIIVFGASFPSAAAASVLVETEGKNGVLACKILAVSTAVSIVSIPAFANLINMLIL